MKKIKTNEKKTKDKKERKEVYGHLKSVKFDKKKKNRNVLQFFVIIYNIGYGEC